MNKSNLIDFMSEQEGINSKAHAKRLVDILFNKVASAIADEGEVSISGLGTFYTINREARSGRNPQTGEPIDIPAKRVPKFRASAILKESVK
jgi:DNA-binding protein HU-beta